MVLSSLSQNYHCNLHLLDKTFRNEFFNKIKQLNPRNMK